MTAIDDHISTYLQAIEFEGKTPKTIASYANSLQDFRRVGTRLAFPDSPSGRCDLDNHTPHAVVEP